MRCAGSIAQLREGRRGHAAASTLTRLSCGNTLFGLYAKSFLGIALVVLVISLYGALGRKSGDRVKAPIAQLDRASDYGSEGWRFESFWARPRDLRGMSE